MALKIGQKAPEIKLPDPNGKIRKLSDYKGKWVLAYFYPKDFTPGCTTEACTLRDAFPDFGKLKAVVLGISTDSVASHRRFVEHYQIPFTLLADPEKAVVKLYGVWGKKKFLGREFFGTLRTSFLINPRGQIAKVYAGVKPAEHAREVLADLSAFKV